MKAWGIVPPTLLTTRSRRPKASRAWSTSAATASRSLRLAGTATARRPAAVDLGGHLVELLGRAGRDDHVGTGLGQRDGGGGADAAAGTGHHGHLVVQPEAIENHVGSPFDGRVGRGPV